MNSARAEQELRRQLADYEYELPSRFATTSTQQPSWLVDSSNQLREYQQARDVYLERKFQHSILKQALTFDGEKFNYTSTAADSDDEEVRAIPRPEEWDELRATQKRVQASITETAASYQRALLELQNKYELFQLRRTELQDMLDHPDSSSFSNDDDDDIDEEELSALQERRSELQKRHAALQVELQTVQHHHDQKVQAVAQHQADYQTLLQQLSLSEHSTNNKESTAGAAEHCARVALWDRGALQELQENNQQLQAKVETMTQAKQYYENLRQFVEKVSEVRVLSVDRTESVDHHQRMLLKAQLLQQYDVEIVLEVNKKNRHLLKPVSAKIVSDNSVIAGPTLDEASDHGSNSVVQLQIPQLDDLVVGASDSFQSTVPGEPLRFLLCEIIARIQATQQRVQELTLLHTEALTRIGRYTVGTANSIEYQEVVCSLNYAQMTAVLRLTPDCPLIAGSVFLDQLVGLGGWETDTVHAIKAKVSETQYQSPVEIVRAIKTEIQRLQVEESLVLPATPRMPVRGHVWE